MMDNCIFCKIAAGEIPGKIIYEDDVCLAFLDLSQVTNGHTLIIPKKHAKNILEVDDGDLSHLILIAKKIGNILMDKLDAKGVNILSNANEEAGQTVMHFHIHVIPRYDNNDGINISFSNREDNVDIDDIYHKIKD